MTLVIVGDEAWLPEAWEQEQARREQRRKYNKEYRTRPEVRERDRTYLRRWRAAHPGYTAEWNRRWRAATIRKRVGALHSLSCNGPHRSKKSCKPIPMYDRP